MVNYVFFVIDRLGRLLLLVEMALYPQLLNPRFNMLHLGWQHLPLLVHVFCMSIGGMMCLCLYKKSGIFAAHGHGGRGQRAGVLWGIKCVGNVLPHTCTHIYTHSHRHHSPLPPLWTNLVEVKVMACPLIFSQWTMCTVCSAQITPLSELLGPGLCSGCTMREGVPRKKMLPFFRSQGGHERSTAHLHIKGFSRMLMSSLVQRSQFSCMWCSKIQRPIYSCCTWCCSRPSNFALKEVVAATSGCTLERPVCAPREKCVACMKRQVAFISKFNLQSSLSVWQDDAEPSACS